MLFSEFCFSSSMSRFNNLGKHPFGTVERVRPSVFFHFSNNCLQACFIGRKNATSRGCVKWVEFGGRNTKSILCSLHIIIRYAERCDDKLSPIRHFRPGSLSKYGITIFNTQSSKILPSNHPDEDRL